jgi:hypothetical protein
MREFLLSAAKLMIILGCTSVCLLVIEQEAAKYWLPKLQRFWRRLHDGCKCVEPHIVTKCSRAGCTREVCAKCSPACIDCGSIVCRRHSRKHFTLLWRRHGNGYFLCAASCQATTPARSAATATTMRQA